MTFAIMVLLLGFAFNANAQGIKTASSSKTTDMKKTGKDVKAEDWDKVLKEYEQAVDQCVRLYKSLQNAEPGSNYDKEFDKSLTKAESLRTKIEKSKDKLNRSQVNRFNQANKKLLQVYKKR